MRKTHLINEPRDTHGFSSTEIRRGKPYQDGVIAAHWDGEFRDRVRDTKGAPIYWTEEDYQIGNITTPDLIAQHLDKTPNVA